MLDLAARLGLPAILHNRESGAEMLAMLRRLAPRERPGVFHSFTEDAAYGKSALDRGYLVSFSGMITFRAAENIREAAAGLPLDSMLVETDTPFLAPVPHRGKPCEPAYVVETARRLAEVKKTDLETVAGQTTANFEALFGRRAERTPMSSSRVSRRQFEAYVDEAVAQVPADFRKYLENIVIVVEEEPLEEDYEETDTPDEDELFGIFRGVPYFERETRSLPCRRRSRSSAVRSCAAVRREAKPSARSATPSSTRSAT